MSTASPEIDLKEPELYLNRELSLLEFHARVLEQAKDEEMPLLERLRFLTIASTNLDEFFEIRVSGLKQQVAYQLPRSEPDGMSAAETLRRVSKRVHELVRDQYRVLNDVLLPRLEEKGIRVLKRSAWSERQQRWLQRYFRSEVMPVLTPVGLDPAHPFPRIVNKSLNFIVTIDGKDAYGRSSGMAVVGVPRSLPRLITLPRKIADGPNDFVLLSSVVHAHMSEAFPGLSVTGCSQFRLTRNSDLWVDEEEIDDLMRALKGELPRRNYGAAVRLEVADTCTEEMARYLLEIFELDEDDLYQVNGPVNLHRMVALYELTDMPELKFERFVPRVPKRIEASGGDMFEVVRKRDLLLHHPFDAFSPVLELLRQAAQDPYVLAVKQTLYRTGPDSPVVDALIDAARAGKEVTVVVELRARFDEAANIQLATRLHEAGASVVYGIVGYKAHAKMLMVVRREGRRLRRYVHLGTGNYHAQTARVYTDMSLVTVDREVGEDVDRLFGQLTGPGEVGSLGKLLQSPFTLQRELIAMIEAEAAEARAGRPARIVAKMNSLSEPTIIQALYRASRAGVSIDLIVRGLCCLRPGVPGVSENIRVRSIVGRFLEHTRIFLFHAKGEDLTWCASADWMQRNFFRRVETCFPILDPELAERVRSEGLDVYLADGQQAWSLDSDGTYSRVTGGGPSAQSTLLHELCDTFEDAERRQRSHANGREKRRRAPKARAGKEPRKRRRKSKSPD